MNEICWGMAGDRPEHRHNTNPGEDFSGTIKIFVLFSDKSNSCQVRNHTKFSRCAPFGVRVFIFGNL
jgi:hypothetical protein